MIFGAMIFSTALLLSERVVELVLYLCLRKWAADKYNFRVAREKSTRRSSRRLQVAVSADRMCSVSATTNSCCSVSSDGSTEASQRCENDVATFVQDRATVS